VWLVVFAATRYVSLASICGSATLPFACWFTGYHLNMTLIAAFLAVLAIYKHKANIRRLLAGTEHRIGDKTAAPSGTSGISESQKPETP
jgi:glycerol-3-phosphate acyltransferase PlsY